MVKPEGIRTTAWPKVRAACAALGVEFDPWQEAVGRLMLAKKAGGQYAAGVGGVALSVPRQVGKTFLVGWTVVGLCLTEPGLTVIWTAHHQRTAWEVFEAIQGMAQTATMRPYVARVLTGGGNGSVIFHNGSRILMGARDSGFGRGFSGVDVLVFDEAQNLTERALDDMTPAQNASPNGLSVMIGTPPRPVDSGEAFTRARTEALEGRTRDALWVEFGAAEDLDLDSVEAVAAANPSYPTRTTPRAIERLKRTLTEEAYAREVLGRWDAKPGQEPPAIPPKKWAGLALARVPESWPLAAIGLDMDPARTRLTIAVAAWSPDGIHLELVGDDDPKLGPVAGWSVDDTVAWILARAGGRIPVVVDGYSPARTLEGPLKARRALVRSLSAGELAQASAALFDAVTRDGTVSHFAQPRLDRSLADAVKAPFGPSGAWKVRPRDVESDLGPAMAAICAHFGALKFGRRPRSMPFEGGGDVAPAPVKPKRGDVL